MIACTIPTGQSCGTPAPGKNTLRSGPLGSTAFTTNSSSNALAVDVVRELHDDRGGPDQGGCEAAGAARHAPQWYITPSISILKRNRITDAWTKGKQWHAPKKAFRPGSGLITFAKRMEEKKAKATMKAKENEMKQEKAEEREVSATQSESIVMSSRH